MEGTADTPIASLEQVIKWSEMAAAMVEPAPVIGVAINGKGRAVDEIRAAVASIQRRTGLPTTDVVALGAGPLVEAIMTMS